MNWETGEEDGSGWGGLIPDRKEMIVKSKAVEVDPKETVKCVHCNEPIFDNGTVWVHLRAAGPVDKQMTMVQTQWCYDRAGSTMAESRGMANARTHPIGSIS